MIFNKIHQHIPTTIDAWRTLNKNYKKNLFLTSQNDNNIKKGFKTIGNVAKKAVVAVAMGVMTIATLPFAGIELAYRNCHKLFIAALSTQASKSIPTPLATAEDVVPEYTKDGMPIMDPRATALLYRMQKEFDEVCQQHGIKYFACGGTSLGIERQSPPGIIPWDDDMDVVLPVGEQNKFTPEFEADLLKRGLRLRPHWGGYKLTMLECPPFGKTYGADRAKGQFYWPFIDVFITYKNKADRKIYINTIGKPGSPENRPSTCWPKDYWTEKEINNLTRVHFGPNTIPVAQGNKDYLTRSYGKNWSTRAQQMFDHKAGKPYDNPKIFTLTDFSPAPFDEQYYNNPLPTKG
jgi:hypothetical protein